MLVAAPAVLAALAGCSPGLDPTLAKPCGERGDPAVVVGTGQYAFSYVGNSGLPVEIDLANGDYMWLAVACRGLGPIVDVDFGIADDLTGAVVTAPAPTRLTLAYDSDFFSQSAPDRAEGLLATFQLPTTGIANVAQLVGRHVTFYANVNDDCPGPDGGAPTVVHGTSPTFVSGYDELTCAGCLDGQCAPELAACGLECVALQGCLDTWCSNLSKLGSPEETTCQLYCESLHPAGKTPLVQLAQCLQTTTCQTAPVDCTPTVTITCQAPCFGWSIDYRHCTNLLDLPGTGGCADALAACNATPACVDYKACTSRCTTWAECQACAPDCSTVCAGDGGSTAACNACNASGEGQALYEAHQLCLERTCLPQGWVPHLNSSSSLE
jgi:hypothetical protein